MIARIYRRLHDMAVLNSVRTRCFFYKYALRRRWIDYGLAKMVLSLDGDLQEIYYHAHFAEWYKREHSFFCKILNNGDKVIDVGANMGFLTILFADLVGPVGKVFSFEPSKNTYAKLLEMVEINQRENCFAYNQGCGDREARMQLKTTAHSSGHFSIAIAPTRGDTSESVSVVPLDSVDFGPGRVALLKIDTEGFEPQVLAGARHLIQRDHPLIYIELGSNHPTSSAAAARLLQDWGYSIVSPAMKRSPDGSIDWASALGIENYLWRRDLPEVARSCDDATGAA